MWLHEREAKWEQIFSPFVAESPTPLVGSCRIWSSPEPHTLSRRSPTWRRPVRLRRRRQRWSHASSYSPLQNLLRSPPFSSSNALFVLHPLAIWFEEMVRFYTVQVYVFCFFPVWAIGKAIRNRVSVVASISSCQLVNQYCKLRHNRFGVAANW